MSDPKPEPTAHEEWMSFFEGIAKALEPFREVRKNIIHTENIAKAQGLANSLNHSLKCWK